jgi:tRNA-specific 2-thiouridylase
MRERGCETVGVTMCLGVDTADGSGVRCCGPEAIADARRVCDILGIPHYVFDFSEPLRKHVVDDFVSEYHRGRTPNPCVRCNRYLKFGALLAKAEAMGFDALVTGHYARIEKLETKPCLLRPRDLHKDQTYFLYQIRREDLPCIRFPLGDLTKDETRDLANRAGLPVAAKAASQDICFVTDSDYRRLVGTKADGGTGELVDTQGQVLGYHRGVSRFTVGQRRGLGVAAGRRLFVVAIDAHENRVVLGDREDLAAQGLRTGPVNLLTDTIPKKTEVQIRYGHPPVRCTTVRVGETLEVHFDHPEEAVAPGQSAVFYDKNRVLGGGIIEEAIGSPRGCE